MIARGLIARPAERPVNGRAPRCLVAARADSGVHDNIAKHDRRHDRIDLLAFLGMTTFIGCTSRQSPMSHEREIARRLEKSKTAGRCEIWGIER
jgi:hypothetical protein